MDVAKYKESKERKSNKRNGADKEFLNTSLSIKLDEDVGTPLYHSPEQISKRIYNEKVDIFAMGLILYEMCANFKTTMERRKYLEKLRSGKIIREDVLKNFQTETELILMMTENNMQERPSAEDISNSRQFKLLASEFNEQK